MCTMYLLAQRPDVLTRLRQEIIDSIGDGTPSTEDLRNMKYLRAVINGSTAHIITLRT
jgi:cytochrome P450